MSANQSCPIGAATRDGYTQWPHVMAAGGNQVPAPEHPRDDQHYLEEELEVHAFDVQHAFVAEEVRALGFEQLADPVVQLQQGARKGTGTGSGS